MSASRATSGGGAASSQFDNHADWIDAIVAAVLNTGGTVGAGTLAQNIGWKRTTLSASGGSGQVTVIHGLPFTPQSVLMNIAGNPNSGTALYGIKHVSNITPSQFFVYFGNTFSAGVWTPAGNGQSITFDWLGLP